MLEAARVVVSREFSEACDKGQENTGRCGAAGEGAGAGELLERSKLSICCQWGYGWPFPYCLAHHYLICLKDDEAEEAQDDIHQLDGPAGKTPIRAICQGHMMISCAALQA
jgi:hypothetical protein